MASSVGVASTVGIHTLVLRAGVEGPSFEALMIDEVLPAAAETPGSVNRAGRSSIKSQHLLKRDGESGEYLWLVKASGVFDVSLFSRVVDRMLEDARDKVDRFATVSSSSVFTVVDSFDAGSRDESGRPTEIPARGSEI